MLTAWRHLQLSLRLVTWHTRSSYYYYHYYNSYQFISQWPLSLSAEMSPSRRRRCCVELPPKHADVERCWTWFVGHSCQSAADFHDEVKGLLAPGSRCLDREREEINAGCDVSVLLRFHRFCCCCHWTSTCIAGQNVRHGERLWASHIPC